VLTNTAGANAPENYVNRSEAIVVKLVQLINVPANPL